LEYFAKEEVIDNKKIKIKLWDTAGQEQYKSLTKNFYRNANGIIIVFDLTNRKSFECVKDWMNNIREYANKETKIALIGNKNDLLREVGEAECESLASSFKIKYFDCSAKENLGFRDCVVSVVTEISQKTKQENEFGLETNKKEENKCLC